MLHPKYRTYIFLRHSITLFSSPVKGLSVFLLNKIFLIACCLLKILSVNSKNLITFMIYQLNLNWKPHRFITAKNTSKERGKLFKFSQYITPFSNIAALQKFHTPSFWELLPQLWYFILDCNAWYNSEKSYLANQLSCTYLHSWILAWLT